VGGRKRESMNNTGNGRKVWVRRVKCGISLSFLSSPAVNYDKEGNDNLESTHRLFALE